MSAYVFPSLIGQAMEVTRETIWPTTIRTSPSGREDRTTWASAPRYRWKVRLNVLRSYVNVTGAWGTYSEVATVQFFIATHLGQGDSFHYVCPYDGTDRVVRFSEGRIPMVRVVNNVWSADLDLMSVI